MSEIKKEIDLSGLPRKMHGDKERVDWQNSIGCECKFLYDDINGKFDIVSYKSIGQYLTINYNDELYRISSSNFMYCKFGKILKKHTSEFKIGIGSKLKNKKRNIMIINKKYKNNIRGQDKKWYKYICLNCGWAEGWCDEVSLLKGHGCSCCSNKTVVQGINDIPTTATWMVKYFQGGEEEAKLYTKCSGKKIYPMCPYCGKIKDKKMAISTIYKTSSIGCSCSDGKPYDEKLFYHIVNEQLGLNMLWGANKNDYPWMETKIYDFVDEENKTIWELDGGLGHGNKIHSRSNKTLEETINDDKYKDELAKNNGYKVIRIDTNYDNDDRFDYIKNSIKSSYFSTLYNIKDINWVEANKFASKNLSKEICLYYVDNQELTQKEISEIFKLHPTTVIKYLNQGEKFGWCSNIKERSRKSANIRASKKLSKKVLCVELNETFKSASECARQLSIRFNKRFSQGHISSTCRGERNHHQGLTFKYV